MNDRYLVVEGSQSGHCCFDFTVVDSSEPLMLNGEHYKNRFKQVCECFYEEDARMIADALNFALAKGRTLCPNQTSS